MHEILSSADDKTAPDSNVCPRQLIVAERRIYASVNYVIIDSDDGH